MSGAMQHAHDHTRSCPFRQCPTCGTRWDTRGAFLDDPHNRWNGYQEDLTRGEGGSGTSGYAVFTHMAHKCGTSMAIPVCDLGVLLGCPHLGPSGHCACAAPGSPAASIELPYCKQGGDSRGATGSSAGSVRAA